MNFSKMKLTTLKPQKEKYLSTFLIALFVSAAFFVPYMIMSEGYFTFYGDFNVQQIPFYQECHKAVKSGNIFWSWTTDLGSNFIGSYSFYLLGSPFFWLTIPFPNSFVPYLMGPLLILKFGCAALTSYFYIRRFTRTPEAARLGGLLYAFSGFSVYNIFFNHFHEPMIFFPLLLLALEMLITENKRFVFALAVCICAVCNYFFFFGMVVFTVIYFFVRLFSGAVNIKFSRFAALAFEAVLGLLLSASLLLPSIMAITGNGRISEILIGWNAIMYGKESIYANALQCFFFPPDIPARPIFFPKADVAWSSLGGWLPLFSMVGVFTFFAKRKNHWLKRVIGICIFMAMVPFLNSSFYAFNSSYYARWYYMPILMMALATVTLTEDREVDWSFGYKWVLGITVAVTAVIGFFPQKNDAGELIWGLYSQGANWDEKLTYAVRFFVSCAIAIISLIALGFLLKTLKEKRQTFNKCALVCVCIISIVYGNVFVACGRSHSYDVKSVMIDQLIEGEVDLGDTSQFRVDVYDGVDNTSMYLGLSGINAFHSVVPSSIMEFYEYIGVSRDVASRPDTDVYAIRPLLSVKYLLNSKSVDSFVDEDSRETEMAGYSYVKTENDYYIYENDNYIPYGFSYDYYMNYEFCNGYEENLRANLMLKAMLLTEEQIQKYGHLFEDISTLGTMTYYSNEEDKTLLLSEDAISHDSEKLAATSAQYFSIDNRGFTARVEREKETLVFFSVPYDEGWTATVNGKTAEIEKVNVGFMAVKVDAGTSDIRFNYTTPGLKNGLLVSTVGAAILLLYIIVYTVYSKKHMVYNNYPEGDALIKKWKSEELLEKEEDDFIEPVSEEKINILDTDLEIDIPKDTGGFEGGFKINVDIDEDN